MRTELKKRFNKFPKWLTSLREKNFHDDFFICIAHSSKIYKAHVRNKSTDKTDKSNMRNKCYR